MKILHVIPNLLVGGAEKLLVELIEAQLQAGDQVEVFCVNRTGTHLEAALDQMVPVTFADSKRYYSMKAIQSLMKFVKSRQYDVIHSHLTPAQLMCMVLFMSNLYKKAKFITTEHSTSNTRRNSLVFKIVDYFLYAPYSTIICISQATAEHLVAWMPSTRKKVKVIFNGIILGKYTQVNAEKFDTPRPNLISVARLEEQKDQDTLIRAHALYGKGTLRLVGEGRRLADLQALCEAVGVQDRVQFLGSRDDVPALLAASDIYVQSSHWEGFGLAAVEGMAAGLPTIASDTPGLSEVVGGAGFLFPPGDANALRDILVKLEDPETVAHASHSCQERAQQFGLDRMVSEYRAVYEAAAPSSTPG